MEIKNEIVVYQPDEAIRLDVRLDGETVWLTQNQMAILFGCSVDNVGLHLKNIYAIGELTREATAEEFSVVRMEGSRRVRRRVTGYNLDAIISVGYRGNSVLGVRFRQWATGVLKDYLLRGYAINQRMNQLEDKVDRRLARHESDIASLKEKVDFFVQPHAPCLWRADGMREGGGRGKKGKANWTKRDKKNGWAEGVWEGSGDLWSGGGRGGSRGMRMKCRSAGIPPAAANGKTCGNANVFCNLTASGRRDAAEGAATGCALTPVGEWGTGGETHLLI